MDWEELAKQHGSIGFQKGSGVDWAAAAKAAGVPQNASQPPQEGFWHSLGSVFGLTPEQLKARAESDAAHPILNSLINATPGLQMAISTAQTAPGLAKKAMAESDASNEALRHGNLTDFMAHQIGGMGYTAATLLSPILGDSPAKAGEQFGEGNIKGGLGTTTGLIAPIAIGEVARSKPSAMAHEVTPQHVEALTGLIDDRAGTVDPHETASSALPYMRETAVRMKIDPSQLKGREAGQATLKIAEQSVRDTQNEFDTIRKPYNSVLVDQRPIAQAYRSAITPEMQANEPQLARALEAEAKKFEQPAPLEQVNQFRTRMNNRLDAYERKGTSAQLMSDVQVRADAAAANAARDVEYQTLGRVSGLDPNYVRELKQREGSLIEAKRSLEKEYNKASGAQGNAVSQSFREKLGHVYPSPRGVQHAGIRELIAPKPIDALNHRIELMFKGMGEARPLPEYEQVQGGPSGPVPTGDAPKAPAAGERGLKVPERRTFMRTTEKDIKEYYNYRFDQLRDELKSAETPEQRADVERRMDELKQTQQAHPTSEGGVGKVAPQVAPPKPPTVEAGKATSAHVAEENAFYTQARAELGAQADPSAVLRRAQELELAAQKPTLTQKVQAQPLPTLRRVSPSLKTPVNGPQSPSGASPQAQATAWMLAAKQGQVTSAEADKQIQRLLGSRGRRTLKRPSGPE